MQIYYALNDNAIVIEFLEFFLFLFSNCSARVASENLEQHLIIP